MILHNPTEAPITDYPIQDPESKKVSLWSINPGETLQFPDHVGEYLLYVYGFLQKVMTAEERQAEQDQLKRISEGIHFSQVKIVTAEPVAALVPAPNPGFTTSNALPQEDVSLSAPQMEAPTTEL